VHGGANGNGYVIDSGANVHVTHNKDHLRDWEVAGGELTGGGIGSLPIHGKGTVVFVHPDTEEQMVVKNVLYAPDTAQNLISSEYFAPNGGKIMFNSDSVWHTLSGVRQGHNERCCSYRSTKQKTIAQSSIEAEYLALGEAVKESLWLKQLSEQVGLKVKKPIKIYEDNQGAIALSSHPSNHSRTKHIDINNHFIRDHVARKDCEIEPIRTDEMIADELTKFF
jgi:hypothetical protein